MDILKQALAPIPDAAWEQIREEAVRVLRSQLTARKVVDVRGPRGLDCAAVGVGHLDIAQAPAAEGIRYGVHRVQPLIELRAAFELGIWTLDDAERGARDLDLEPLTLAAKRVARFEDQAVFHGFPEARIPGLFSSSAHDAIKLGPDASSYPEAVARAMVAMQDSGVGGPYAVVFGPQAFEVLASECHNCEPLVHVEKLVGGPVHVSPVVEGGFLLSTRGGDFELTLGQDTSIGYETHDAHKVRLYLVESFTFRILDARAVAPLKVG